MEDGRGGGRRGRGAGVLRGHDDPGAFICVRKTDHFGGRRRDGGRHEIQSGRGGVYFGFPGTVNRCSTAIQPLLFNLFTPLPHFLSILNSSTARSPRALLWLRWGIFLRAERSERPLSLGWNRLLKTEMTAVMRMRRCDWARWVAPEEAIWGHDDGSV